jgi:transglutaminase-like putative cysteine protease
MELQIEHHTHYRYEAPVRLQPHLLRLCPRSDGTQKLQSFDLQISPAPLSRGAIVDLDGNNPIQVWFNEELTTELTIVTKSLVNTQRINPFDFILATWANQLPIDYPQSLAQQLQPYIGIIVDPIAQELARQTVEASGGEVLIFLRLLTEKIYSHCTYQQREQGAPLTAGTTWLEQRGSCRDFAWLWMTVCRSVGLATRFVSGYERGDPEMENYLHAWAEVYLPGGGWRGWDPTHGLAVAEGYVALVASAYPQWTLPVEGQIVGANRRSVMSHRLWIRSPA